jgi:hypothetical protein
MKLYDSLQLALGGLVDRQGKKKCSQCWRKRSCKHFETRSYGSIDGLKSFCRDCSKKLKRCWYGKNKNKAKQSRDRWESKNKEKMRISRNEWRRKLRVECIQAYGGKCMCPGCKERKMEFLTIDHVDNNGAMHRKQVGRSIFIWLKRNGFPKRGFRVLCYNCNCSRGSYGYCPHERER